MNAEQATATAKELRLFAKRLEEIMYTLDTESFPCDCCGTIRYKNWQQNQLFSRLDGITEKVENAAVLLDKGATNPEFLEGGSVKKPELEDAIVSNDPNTGHER